MSRLFSIVVVLLLGTQLAYAQRATTYYHTDSLGSVVAASDQNGALLWRKEYRPFGEQLDSTAENEKLAYTGKEQDDVTRLTYFGARYYDPELGRFLSIDPAGVDPANPLSFNRYAYANNNPYRFIDPDGRQACDDEECKDYRIRTQGRDARGAGMVRDGGEGLSDVADKEASSPWNWIPFVGGLKKADRLAGDHIVLGLRAFGLESTAAKVGGRTLLRERDWMQSLLTAIRTPGTRFTVSVEGLSGTSVYSKVMGSAQRGLMGSVRREGTTGVGYTDWELAQLYQAGRLKDVTFVNRAGEVLDNPF